MDEAWRNKEEVNTPKSSGYRPRVGEPAVSDTDMDNGRRWPPRHCCGQSQTEAAGLMQYYIRNGGISSLDSDLSGCWGCMETYHQTRARLVREEGTSHEKLLECEEKRIAALLKRSSASHEDILLPIAEVLCHPFLLFSQTIESAFCSKLLELSATVGLEAFLQDHSPSMYILLVHPNSEIRDLAWQWVCQPEYHITRRNYTELGPALGLVLALPSRGQRKAEVSGRPRSEVDASLPEHLLCTYSQVGYWQGLARLLAIFSEGALKEVHKEPTGVRQFISWLMYNLSKCKGDVSGGPLAPFWCQLQCLISLTAKLGSAVWQGIRWPTVGLVLANLRSFLCTPASSAIGSRRDDSAEKEPSEWPTTAQQLIVSPTNPFCWIPDFVNSLLDIDEGVFIMKEVAVHLCYQLGDLRRGAGATADPLLPRLMAALAQVFRSLLGLPDLGQLAKEVGQWMEALPALLRGCPLRGDDTPASTVTEDSRQLLVRLLRLALRDGESAGRALRYIGMLALPPRQRAVSPEKLRGLVADQAAFPDCVELVHAALLKLSEGDAATSVGPSENHLSVCGGGQRRLPAGSTSKCTGNIPIKGEPISSEPFAGSPSSCPPLQRDSSDGAACVASSVCSAPSSGETDVSGLVQDAWSDSSSSSAPSEDSWAREPNETENGFEDISRIKAEDTIADQRTSMQPAIVLETITELEAVRGGSGQFRVLDMEPLTIQSCTAGTARHRKDSEKKRGWDCTSSEELTSPNDSSPRKRKRKRVKRRLPGAMKLESLSSEEDEVEEVEWCPGSLLATPPKMPQSQTSMLSKSSPFWGSSFQSPRSFPKNRLSLSRRRQKPRPGSNCSSGSVDEGSRAAEAPKAVAVETEPRPRDPAAEAEREGPGERSEERRTEDTEASRGDGQSDSRQLLSPHQALRHLEVMSGSSDDEPRRDQRESSRPEQHMSSSSDSGRSWSLLRKPLAASGETSPARDPDGIRRHHESSGEKIQTAASPDSQPGSDTLEVFSLLSEEEGIKSPVHLLVVKRPSSLGDSSPGPSVATYSQDQDDIIIDLESYNCSQLVDDDCLSQLIVISSDEDTGLDLDKSSDEDLSIDLNPVRVKVEREEDSDRSCSPTPGRDLPLSQTEDSDLMNALYGNNECTPLSSSSEDEGPRCAQGLPQEDGHQDEALREGIRARKGLEGPENGRLGSRIDQDDRDHRLSTETKLPQSKYDSNSLESESHKHIQMGRDEAAASRKESEATLAAELDERRAKNCRQELQKWSDKWKRAGGADTGTDEGEPLPESRTDAHQRSVASAPKIRGTRRLANSLEAEEAPADAQPLRMLSGRDEELQLLDTFALEDGQPPRRPRHPSGRTSSAEERPRPTCASRFSSRAERFIQDMRGHEATTRQREEATTTAGGEERASLPSASSGVLRPAGQSLAAAVGNALSSPAVSLPGYAQAAYAGPTPTASTDHTSHVHPGAGSRSADRGCDDVELPWAGGNPPVFQFFTSDKATLETATSLTDRAAMPPATSHSASLTGNLPADGPRPAAASSALPLMVRQSSQPSLPPAERAGEGAGASETRDPPGGPSVSLQPQAIVQLPKTAPFSLTDLHYWITGWKCQWLDIYGPQSEGQSVTSTPPILAECRYKTLQDVAPAYDSLDSYYETFVPLLLHEIWVQMQLRAMANLPVSEARMVECQCRERRPEGFLLQCTCRVLIVEGAPWPFKCDDVIRVSPGEEITSIWRPLLGIVVGMAQTANRATGDGASPVNPVETFLEVCFVLQAKSEENCRSIMSSANHVLRLQPILSLSSALHQFKGLVSLPRCNLLASDILRFRRRDVFHTVLPIRAPAADSGQKLTQSQEAVVSAATNVVVLPDTLPRIVLVRALPATGKTDTTVALVDRILQNQRRAESEAARQSRGTSRTKSPPILLCAPTDLAVNILLRKLEKVVPSTFLHRPPSEGFLVVRVGSSNLVHQSVRNFSLQRQVAAMRDKEYKEIKRTMDRLKQNLDKLSAAPGVAHSRETTELSRKIQTYKTCLRDQRRRREELLQRDDGAYEQAILAKADVICCTPNASGSDVLQSSGGGGGNLQQRMKFSCMIVDEASQCSEVDSIIPLQSCSMKVILVGDSKHLASTVSSEETRRRRFHQSLFERLCKWFDGKPPEVLQLQEQKRMHKDIASFPSRHFYGGSLLTDSVQLMRKDFFLRPYLLFNVLHSKEVKHSPRSFSNEAEASMVIALYNRICHSKQGLRRMVSANLNISIVVPYKDQISLLERLHQEAHAQLAGSSHNPEFRAPFVEICTMDELQGREKDILIMCCVRAHGRLDSASLVPSFLTDERCLNFVLTRARFSLFIVGHLPTLQKNKDWKALAADAHERRAVVIVRGTEYNNAARHCSNPSAKRGSGTGTGRPSQGQQPEYQLQPVEGAGADPRQGPTLHNPAIPATDPNQTAGPRNFADCRHPKKVTFTEGAVDRSLPAPCQEASTGPSRVDQNQRRPPLAAKRSLENSNAQPRDNDSAQGRPFDRENSEPCQKLGNRQRGNNSSCSSSNSSNAINSSCDARVPSRPEGPESRPLGTSGVVAASDRAELGRTVEVVKRKLVQEKRTLPLPGLQPDPRLARHQAPRPSYLPSLHQPHQRPHRQPSPQRIPYHPDSNSSSNSD